MESKSLGKTNLIIPEIGLDTSRYRGGVAPLRKGIRVGAFIDTAEMYGTEDVVGSPVGNSQDSTIITTKVLPRMNNYMPPALVSRDACVFHIQTT